MIVVDVGAAVDPDVFASAVAFEIDARPTVPLTVIGPPVMPFAVSTVVTVPAPKLPRSEVIWKYVPSQTVSTTEPLEMSFAPIAVVPRFVR